MSGPIRVLHIVTYMGRGGLETMLMNYYRNIDREKVQFDFLVHRMEKYDYDDEIESLGGNIYRFNRLNPFSINYKNKLFNFFKEHTEYRIVHCHLDCMSSVPLKVAKKAGVPVRIAHAHNTNQDKNLKYILKMYYKRKIKKYSTHLFACSQDAGKWMFNTDDFKVLPNAIDAKKYMYDLTIRNQIRKELNLNDSIVFGHVGRFSYPKNHSFLIDIFTELKKIYPNSKLILVGGGDGVPYIKQKVENSKLENDVLFLGVRSDVNRILQALDVLVFPSLYEGLPLTIVEAQASGLPCFISDKVPIECKKTDLVYQLCLSDSAKKWAEFIQLVLCEFSRINKYEEIVRSGFDVKENVKILKEFYSNLHGSRDFHE